MPAAIDLSNMDDDEEEELGEPKSKALYAKLREAALDGVLYQHKHIDIREWMRYSLRLTCSRVKGVNCERVYNHFNVSLAETDVGIESSSASAAAAPPAETYTLKKKELKEMAKKLRSVFEHARKCETKVGELMASCVTRKRMRDDIAYDIAMSMSAQTTAFQPAELTKRMATMSEANTELLALESELKKTADMVRFVRDEIRPLFEIQPQHQCSVCYETYGTKNPCAVMDCGHTCCHPCTEKLPVCEDTSASSSSSSSAAAVAGKRKCPTCRRSFKHAKLLYLS